MKVRKTKSKNIINRVLGNDQLAQISLTDAELEEFQAGTYDPVANPDDNFLAIIDDHKVIAILKYEAFTPLAISCHMFIHPDYWGSKCSYKIIPAIENWFKKHTQIHKLIVMSPESCTHVHMTAAKNGFWLEGCLTGAMYWRGQVEALLIFSKFINRRDI